MITCCLKCATEVVRVCYVRCQAIRKTLHWVSGFVKPREDRRVQYTITPYCSRFQVIIIIIIVIISFFLAVYYYSFGALIGGGLCSVSSRRRPSRRTAATLPATSRELLPSGPRSAFTLTAWSRLLFLQTTVPNFSARHCP